MGTKIGKNPSRHDVIGPPLPQSQLSGQSSQLSGGSPW